MDEWLWNPEKLINSLTEEEQEKEGIKKIF